MKEWLQRHRVDVFLVALAFVVLAPIVAPETAQPASRMALTGAIAEHHTPNIKGFPIGVDYSVYHGVRSDKAPGQPVLAVPFYLAARAVGAQSAAHLRPARNLTVWWVTLWSTMIPFALLLVLMRRLAERVVGDNALPATIVLGFTTLMLPFAVNLFGHLPAALPVFAAWVMLQHEKLTDRRLLTIGLLCGVAIATEYETAIAVVALLAFAAWRVRRRAGWLLVGTAPPALLLALYQWIAFGAPWHTSYQYYIAKVQGRVDVSWHVPNVSSSVGLFVGDRGLLLVSPVVVIAVVAAALALREKNVLLRAHAVAGLGIFVAYAVLVAGWTRADPAPELPGPRWLIPAIPFLVVPLASQWRRLRLPILACAAWGAFMMFCATFTAVLVGEREPLLHAFLPRLQRREFVPTLWSMAAGRVGVVLYLASIAIVASLFMRAARAHRPAPAPELVGSSR